MDSIQDKVGGGDSQADRQGEVKWHRVAVSVRSKGCHMQELDTQQGKQGCQGSNSEILEDKIMGESS